MTQITGKNSAMGIHSLDLAATWSAVKDLQDAFQAVCSSARTLVICDEHHHAAIEAAWAGKLGLGDILASIERFCLRNTPQASQTKRTSGSGH